MNNLCMTDIIITILPSKQENYYRQEFKKYDENFVTFISQF